MKVTVYQCRECGQVFLAASFETLHGHHAPIKPSCDCWDGAWVKEVGQTQLPLEAV